MDIQFLAVDDFRQFFAYTSSMPPQDDRHRVYTYIAANYPYNVAGNMYDSNGYYQGQMQQTFPYAFQPSSYPMYACDQRSGPFFGRLLTWQ